MSIVKMKKLELLAASAQKDDILRELMLLGCVEITEPPEELEDSVVPLTRSSDRLQHYRSQHTRLTMALAILDKYAPEKRKLLSAKPEITTGRLLDERGISDCLDTAEEIIYLDDQIRRIGIAQSRERAAIEAMKPWTDLDLPLGFEGTKACFVMPGTLPLSSEETAVTQALWAAAPESELEFISADKTARYALLICMNDERDQALEALREFGFAQTGAGDARLTARESIALSESKLRDYAIGIEGLSASIASLAETRAALRKSADTISTHISREEAKKNMLCTETVFTFSGWISAPDEARAVAVMEKYDCAYELRDPTPEEYPFVPVKLKNSRLTRALNMVTEMYSLPAYDGVDPNPLMAPFFILFYGIMMADMGYGLLMTVGAIIAKAKMKPKGGARNFVELLLLCGISTFVWGALTGGFFGDAPYQIVHILDPASTWQGLPSLFNPLNDTVMILLGSMALGFVQIVTGMAISFVEKLKKGEIMDAIWEEVTWWVVFIGIALFAMGAGNIGGVPVILCIGGVMILVGSGWNARGFGKITAVFGSLYNHVTGYFGDILSYSRLMALMLAGSVIAQVFNTIGAIFGNIFLFLIISIIGNALNFALNLLGCYVHDLRLQCLEYFGKFYKDGGKAFRPLAVNTKYLSVTDK